MQCSLILFLLIPFAIFLYSCVCPKTNRFAFKMCLNIVLRIRFSLNTFQCPDNDRSSDWTSVSIRVSLTKRFAAYLCSNYRSYYYLVCLPLFWKYWFTIWVKFKLQWRDTNERSKKYRVSSQTLCYLSQAIFYTQRRRGRKSVTRLGDLLDFGQLFKAFGIN